MTNDRGSDLRLWRLVSNKILNYQIVRCYWSHSNLRIGSLVAIASGGSSLLVPGKGKVVPVLN
jgi:acetyltransferase-like isoleucine patch superfamily enzyme